MLKASYTVRGFFLFSRKNSFKSDSKLSIMYFIIDKKTYYVFFMPIKIG